MLWEDTLDGRYRCYVEQDDLDPYTGELYVWDTEDVRNPVLKKPVIVQHAAIFGPDSEDLAHWQLWCVQAVDALKAGEAEPLRVAGRKER